MAETHDVDIVDAHQHIWSLSRADYPWMDPADEIVHRDYTIDDAVAELDAAGIDGTVLVQSADNAEDSLTMFDAAHATGRVRGVVAWIPLDDPAEAERLLARWRAESAFCGIRSLIHSRDDDSWLASRAAAPGLRLLAELGIPFDVVAVTGGHLRAAIEVGERHPELRMVIDHLGRPPIKADDDGEWTTLMTEVAANPRVFAKVSGLYATAGPMDAWETTDIAPWVEKGLDMFGVDRLMYGGDWPISRLGGGYARVWDALSRIAARLDHPDRARLLSGTAKEFYGLGSAAGVDANDAGALAEGERA